MRQAITTKYHGPTNTRGSRISATSASGTRIYVPYAYELSVDECHEQAAKALCTKLGWTGQMVAGYDALLGGDLSWISSNVTGNVYVFAD